MVPLSTLRSSHLSATLVELSNDVPRCFDEEETLWDNGMQSYRYCISDGASVYHIFTGNQEHLQGEATELLAEMQCHLLLARQDMSSESSAALAGNRTELFSSVLYILYHGG